MEGREGEGLGETSERQRNFFKSDDDATQTGRRWRLYSLSMGKQGEGC